ncbi:MAG: hypothetical protein GQ570_12935 [Helicobacteraceae bacterium]|nr:hypothetical protein [Helicobacteraceae bacterium]
MYAVEFQASIENGIVHIPTEYKDLLSNKKATFVAMYDSVNKQNTIKNKTQKQLDEFDRLVAQSDNKVMATMELATNIDDMVLDGIL